MAWKELRVVDLRQEFVLRALHERGSFAELCREFGISTKTGYKWKARFEQVGPAGLADLSRRPLCSPQELGDSVVCAIVRLKQAHRTWGARKLREVYRRSNPLLPLPSESSFKRILKDAGLVERRVRRPIELTGRLQTRLVPQASNELWTVDFKGNWYTPTGERCEPLTVRDAYSRFILCASLPANGRTETIQEEFERLFCRYGLPGTIRSDNGSPFASTRAPLGLSRLSAWWVALGIDLDRTDPGHPEQNGAHERMHRDIAAELERRIDGNLAAHAAALEVWRQSYNEERPHEALGMRTPAEVYAASDRPFRGTPTTLTYGSGFLQRRVTRRGEISIDGRYLLISTALSGWDVGLKPVGDGLFALHFGRLCLGRVDLETESFTCEARAASEG